MVDWYGTPHTQALHVVERYRLMDYEAAKEGLERDAKENYQVPRGSDGGPAVDPQLQGQAPATPIHRRRRRRFHDAVVGNHNFRTPDIG